MYVYNLTPQHHVTPHNQGQPCSFHALTVQPDTLEVHFGFLGHTANPSNRKCNASLTERSTNGVTQEGNESNAPTNENSTNAYGGAS